MKRTKTRRIFSRSRRRFRLGTFHVALALAALAACTPRTETWSPAESPKRNQVSWIEFHHPVSFAAGSAELAAADRAALDRFLDRIAEGEGVRVTLAAPSGAEPGLALRRETAIVAHLRTRGLRPQLGPSAAAPANGAIRVTVGRHVVTPPNCPDWTKPATGDPGNNTSSNFGCATAANLGLMIADPGALVRGYASGPADGEAMAKSVQNYRENKIPWLPATAGFKIEGSTGGDGKGDSGSGN